MSTTTPAIITIKIDHHGDLRRFKWAPSTLDDLSTTICGVFDIPANTARILWTDADGDHITIATDADLAEVLANHDSGALRLAIDVASPADVNKAAKMAAAKARRYAHLAMVQQANKARAEQQASAAANAAQQQIWDDTPPGGGPPEVRQAMGQVWDDTPEGGGPPVVRQMGPGCGAWFEKRASRLAEVMGTDVAAAKELIAQAQNGDKTAQATIQQARQQTRPAWHQPKQGPWFEHRATKLAAAMGTDLEAAKALLTQAQSGDESAQATIQDVKLNRCSNVLAKLTGESAEACKEKITAAMGGDEEHRASLDQLAEEHIWVLHMMRRLAHGHQGGHPHHHHGGAKGSCMGKGMGMGKGKGKGKGHHHHEHADDEHPLLHRGKGKGKGKGMGCGGKGRGGGRGCAPPARSGPKLGERLAELAGVSLEEAQRAIRGAKHGDAAAQTQLAEWLQAASDTTTTTTTSESSGSEGDDARWQVRQARQLAMLQMLATGETHAFQGAKQEAKAARVEAKQARKEAALTTKQATKQQAPPVWGMRSSSSSTRTVVRGPDASGADLVETPRSVEEALEQMGFADVDLSESILAEVAYAVGMEIGEDDFVDVEAELQ
jgi:hypothetical protein